LSIVTYVDKDLLDWLMLVWLWIKEMRCVWRFFWNILSIS